MPYLGPGALLRTHRRGAGLRPLRHRSVRGLPCILHRAPSPAHSSSRQSGPRTSRSDLSSVNALQKGQSASPGKKPQTGRLAVRRPLADGHSLDADIAEEPVVARRVIVIDPQGRTGPSPRRPRHGVRRAPGVSGTNGIRPARQVLSLHIGPPPCRAARLGIPIHGYAFASRRAQNTQFWGLGPALQAAALTPCRCLLRASGVDVSSLDRGGVMKDTVRSGLG